jgi:SpoVK/Ycf46/Vps4 family AAA+-type ATPase
MDSDESALNTEHLLGSYTLITASESHTNTPEPRIWVSTDALYKFAVAAGAHIYVALADQHHHPKPLIQVFASTNDVDLHQQQSNIGSKSVVATVWPSSTVKRSCAMASSALLDSLGYPDNGTSLLLFRVDLQDTSSSLLSLCLIVGKGGQPVIMGGRPSLLDPTSPPRQQSKMARRRGGGNKAPAVQSPSMMSSINTPPPMELLKTAAVAVSPVQNAATSSRNKNKDIVSTGHQQEALTQLLTSPGQRLISLLESLVLRHAQNRYLMPGNIICLPFMAHQVLLLVEAEEFSSSSQPVFVTPQTRVRLILKDETSQEAILVRANGYGYVEKAVKAAASLADDGEGEGPASRAARRAAEAGEKALNVSFKDLGGSLDRINALKELVIVPLRAPELFQRYGIQTPRGVLLHGPPGTGKTLLARATAGDCGAALFLLNGPDIVSEFYGESEVGIKGVFAAAKACAPSIIFIDEIDAIAPSREDGNTGHAAGRLVTTLLIEMDEFSSEAPVVVVAATNRVDSLDPALRRPGRFDREIEVGIPTAKERRAIFAKKLEKLRHSLQDEEISALAATAHGFVGADITALCSEAALQALRKFVHSNDNAQITVSYKDFKVAETRVSPSAMREIALEVPNVSWDDVGGLDDVKARLKESVEWPIKNSDGLERVGAQVPRGILLFGPPGCSKTLLARAVASQAGMNFLAVKGPELFSKYVGESEKAVALLFAKARRAAPAIVFFDELDGLAVDREEVDSSSVAHRVLSQLLQEMDGLQTREGIVVLAATNRPDCIDAALLRPGRFDRLLYVPPPSEEEREAIFFVHTRKMPVDNIDMALLASKTNGYTGADIAAICREAAMSALEESLEAELVGLRSFEKAIQKVRPSASTVSMELYTDYMRFAN